MLKTLVYIDDVSKFCKMVLEHEEGIYQRAESMAEIREAV